MGSFKLKICKIKSQAFAKYCIKRGVDYLGVHVIEFALNSELKELCNFISSTGGKAVILTKEKNVDKLKQLINFYDPWAIQLHYELRPNKLSELKKQLNCIIVPVFTDLCGLQEVKTILNICDQFAIYDSSFVGGTGQTNSQNLLNAMPKKYLNKILLAGGVTTESVDNKLAIFGYDVQSFCRPNKTHSFARAEQIICKVKNPPCRQLSISLTDATEQKSQKHDYLKSGCLEYQVDYSDGNLYKHFKTDNNRIKAILHAKDAPFTLHIFEKTEAAYQKIINDLTKLFPGHIVRINIQYSPGLNLDPIKTGEANLCASIYHEDFNDYLKKYPQAHECISLILPKEYNQKITFLNENKRVLNTLKNHEIWFDRKMDKQSVDLVLKHNDKANFIIGDYILKNPLSEQKIHASLKR